MASLLPVSIACSALIQYLLSQKSQETACGSLVMSGVQGFFIKAITEEKDALKIDKRIEEFLKEIQVSIMCMFSRTKV